MDVTSVNNTMQTCTKMTQYVTTGMDTVIDIAMDVAEHIPELEVNRADELKDILCEYVGMELQMKQFCEAVEHVKNVASRFKDEDEVPDLDEMLETKLSELKERDEGIDMRHHHKYGELERKIQGERGKETVEQDADLQLTEQEVNTRCPVTGKDMVVPVINTLCGHVYDKEGITQLIKQRKFTAKCPVVGCGNSEPISEEHLREDKDMKRHLAKKRRQNVKMK